MQSLVSLSEVKIGYPVQISSHKSWFVLEIAIKEQVCDIDERSCYEESFDDFIRLRSLIKFFMPRDLRKSSGLGKVCVWYQLSEFVVEVFTECMQGGDRNNNWWNGRGKVDDCSELFNPLV